MEFVLHPWHLLLLTLSALIEREHGGVPRKYSYTLISLNLRPGWSCRQFGLCVAYLTRVGWGRT